MLLILKTHPCVCLETVFTFDFFCIRANTERETAIHIQTCSQFRTTTKPKVDFCDLWEEAGESTLRQGEDVQTPTERSRPADGFKPYLSCSPVRLRVTPCHFMIKCSFHGENTCLKKRLFSFINF